MCETNIYLNKKGNLKDYMEDCIFIKVSQKKLLLRNILGEERLIKAKIKEVDLLKHKIVLEEVS